MINEKKVITIIGAGNVGTAMTAILSQNKELRVIVYSSKKEQWCKELKYRVMDIDKWNVIEGYEVTDNLEYAVINSNQIFITLPSFMRPDMIKKISAYAQPNTLIAFVPGCGGIEYFCRNLIENGCEIIGFDRVQGIKAC